MVATVASFEQLSTTTTCAKGRVCARMPSRLAHTSPHLFQVEMTAVAAQASCAVLGPGAVRAFAACGFTRRILGARRAVGHRSARSLVLALEVLAQRIAEVALEVAPQGVRVVRAVLRVVVLDREARTLDAVVVRLTGLEAAGPHE